MTEYENAEEMLLLARRVVHCPVDIVVPGRKIVKQGCLMKVIIHLYWLDKMQQAFNQFFIVSGYKKW